MRSLLPSTVLFAFLAAGCGEPQPATSAPPDVSVWRLGSEPDISIGVVEGDTNYELFRAIASVRLPGGEIVVANAGSAELRFYGGDGRFLRKAGRRGQGPGEFAGLAGVHGYGPDSLIAYDRRGGRISVFDREGNFVRATNAAELSGDSAFPFDVWLSGRLWVFGAFWPAEREAARRAIGPLVVPDTVPRYRFARPDLAGNVWIQNPSPDPGASGAWTVVDSLGEPVAVVRTPDRFDVQEIGADYVLGRWRDANDVNFIHLYSLEHSSEHAVAPSWLATHQTAVQPAASDSLPIDLRELASTFRKLVVTQEAYYSDHGTYAARIDDLAPWEPPEGLMLEFAAVGRRGWAIVATAPGVQRLCVIAVGGATPAGWPEAAPRCG